MPDARELWFVGPRRVELRRGALRDPGPGEILARGLASGVSQGTEMLLYRGEGPEPFDPSLGGATYPLRYGYAWVGEVVAAGASTPLAAGTRVFALASHADAHVLDAARARALPSALPPEREVLAANLETAVTCAWDAEAALGDRAVVIGGGVVGILTAWLLARAGARVTLVERSALRRAAASALAPSIALATSAPAAARADLIVEATGDPRALDDAVAAAAPGARIVVASFYGKRRAPLDLGDAFHRRRLVLASSQVSSIPPRLSARWTHARRFELVVDLLAEPRLDALLGEPTPFDDAPALYAEMDAAEDAPPGRVFVYR